MKIGIKYDDMPRGFKAWFIRLDGRIRRLRFPDADGVGFEIDDIENEVFQEMLNKFPYIRYVLIDDVNEIIKQC